MIQPVACRFYLRTTVGGRYRYEMIHVTGWRNDGTLRTYHPPDVGDLIYLPPNVRVISRSWQHAQWGSINWPHSQQEPSTGPSLDIVVEEFAGPFVNEWEPEPVEPGNMVAPEEPIP